MIRNICILSLFVLSVQASLLSQAFLAGSSCLNTYKIEPKQLLDTHTAGGPLKCLSLCILKSLGFLDDDGNLDENNFQSAMNATKDTYLEPAISAVYNECSKQGNNTDVCGGAANTVGCVTRSSTIIPAVTKVFTDFLSLLRAIFV